MEGFLVHTMPNFHCHEHVFVACLLLKSTKITRLLAVDLVNSFHITVCSTSSIISLVLVFN